MEHQIGARSAQMAKEAAGCETWTDQQLVLFYIRWRGPVSVEAACESIRSLYRISIQEHGREKAYPHYRRRMEEIASGRALSGTSSVRPKVPRGMGRKLPTTDARRDARVREFLQVLADAIESGADSLPSSDWHERMGEGWPPERSKLSLRTLRAREWVVRDPGCLGWKLTDAGRAYLAELEVAATA